MHSLVVAVFIQELLASKVESKILCHIMTIMREHLGKQSYVKPLSDQIGVHLFHHDLERNGLGQSRI